MTKTLFRSNLEEGGHWDYKSREIEVTKTCSNEQKMYSLREN